MHYVIQRPRWGRGGGDESGYLLDKLDKTMCCIGFVCLAHGLKDSDILERKSIHGLSVPCRSQLPEELLENDNGMEVAWIRQAYVINDRDDITDEEREALLTNLFTKNGHTIEFVDGESNEIPNKP